jgi:Zn-dependent oligopeptidase
VHHETGEVVPDALLAKLKAAQDFNQGFATIEYVCCMCTSPATSMLSHIASVLLL